MISLKEDVMNLLKFYFDWTQRVMEHVKFKIKYI